MSVFTVMMVGGGVIFKLLRANLPIVQTALSLAGTVATPIWVAKSTVRAKDIIDAELEKRGDGATISKGEMVELTWKEYIGPVILCGATCALEVKTTKDLLEKAAAATALAAASAKTLEMTNDKVEQMFGEGKRKKLEAEVDQEKVKEIAAANNGQPIIVGEGKILCMDGFTGRIFHSTMEDLRRAVNDINRDLNCVNRDSAGFVADNEASLNDFWSYINDSEHLTPLPKMNNFGWTTSHPLSVRFNCTLYSNQPMVVVDYDLYDFSTSTKVL